MSKSRTKGEARRAKKARAANGQFARIDSTPRERNGRPARPSATATRGLIIRAEMAGIDVPHGSDGKPKLTPELFRRLRQPWMGCNAGRAIEAEAPDDRAELWGAISAARKAFSRYWDVMGIPAPYPPSARMLYAEDPGSNGTDLDHHFPSCAPLTLEEEAKAASSRMMRVEMVFGLAKWLKSCILFDTPVEDRAVLVRALKLISQG